VSYENHFINQKIATYRVNSNSSYTLFFLVDCFYLLQLHDRFYEGSGQVYKLPIGTVFNITDAKSFYHKVSGTSNNYLLGSVEIEELGKLVEFEIPWGYDGTSSLNNKASFNLFELMPWQEEALPYKFYHDGRKEPHVWPPRIRNYVFNIVAHKFISRDTLQQHRNFENIYEKQEDWAYEKVYFGANNQLSNEQIDFLKLGEIYADYKTKPEKYAFHEDYKLEFSRNFITLIVTVFLGEHEMESQLITYDLDGNKIANLKISYDEIAEGMHKKESFLKGNILTINDIVSLDTATVTTTKYRLLDDGKIELVKE